MVNKGASQVALVIKNWPAMQDTRVSSLGQEDNLEEGMVTPSSILAWEILWTEEPGGYSPWSCIESDITQQLSMHTHLWLRQHTGKFHYLVRHLPPYCFLSQKCLGSSVLTLKCLCLVSSNTCLKFGLQLHYIDGTILAVLTVLSYGSFQFRNTAASSFLCPLSYTFQNISYGSRFSVSPKLFLKTSSWEFSGGPVARTTCCQCRGQWFNLWLGN